jgi:NAD(P)-dependent dehydrogenase (short-subunit alcohol dehydrogenase family)
MTTNWNWLQGTSNDMDGGMAPAPVFAGQKLVVVGGSSGMGRQTAADVVAAGGSAVIIGREPDKVGGAVKELSESGSMAYGITADLSDRMAAEAVCAQLAADHADATLLVNAAGLFLPKPFLDHDGADYDSYAEFDRAIFFITQTVARGMVAAGRGGSIVNIGSMWAHQAIGATPSSAYSAAKGGLRNVDGGVMAGRN